MDRYTPNLGHQQKCEAAWADIPQNRAISKNVREEENRYEKQSETLRSLDICDWKIEHHSECFSKKFPTKV